MREEDTEKRALLAAGISTMGAFVPQTALAFHACWNNESVYTFLTSLTRVQHLSLGVYTHTHTLAQTLVLVFRGRL